MTTYELSYPKLGLDLHEVYVQMGYGDAAPDADVVAETKAVEAGIAGILRPRYTFFIAEGTLDDTACTLNIGHTELNVGRIIARQLRGSEAFAFFVATAGAEFEDYQMRLKDDDDMVRTFIADSFGSVIAELTADVMERTLQDDISGRGWRRRKADGVEPDAAHQVGKRRRRTGSQRAQARLFVRPVRLQGLL